MPITISEFNDIENKVITLMGMSGVGKTYLSTMLEGQGWKHYSCDYQIAKDIGLGDQVTKQDISALSHYVGRLGNPAKGGFALDEFKKRQRTYFEAECASLNALKKKVSKAHEDGFTHVVNDSTGSMCEIDDDTLFDFVDEHSLIVYIKASPEEEKAVLKRAQEYPKPLFYSPERFDYWLAEFLSDQGLSAAEEIEPDEFSRWVFPRLFENRLPKYQAIADKYGTTIPSEAFRDVKTEDEFLAVIVAHLKETL